MVETHAGSISRGAERHGGVMQRGMVSYLVAAVDLIIIITAAIASGLSYNYVAFGVQDSWAKYFAIGLVFAAGFVLLMVAKGYYRPSVLVFSSKQFFYIIASSFLLATFLALVVFLLGASESFSRGAI